MSVYFGDPNELSFLGAEDISFYISDSYLGICKAEISWKNNNSFEVNIIDGENVLYFIKTVDFIPID